MKEQELILRLIYLALLDIRESSHSSGDRVSYHLSNFFHNIPLEFHRALNGEISFEDLLEDLKNESNNLGCDFWLENAIKHIDP